MSTHAIGLVAFIAVVVLDAAGLLLDLFLWLTGRTTITQRVWARPILGTPIMAMQVVGVVGLFVHFYGAKS